MGKSTNAQFLTESRAKSSIKHAGLSTNQTTDQSHAQWSDTERAWVPIEVNDYVKGCAQARKWGAVDWEVALSFYGRHLKQTRERCEALAARGYLFVAGNHPKLAKSKRWSTYDVVRVAICNSRDHGFSLKTIWAVRPKSDEGSE